MVRWVLSLSLGLLLTAAGPAWCLCPPGAAGGMTARSGVGVLTPPPPLHSILPSWRGKLAAQNPERLQSTARSLARSWAEGSDRAVAAHLASGRVSLHLEGGVSASLPTRQAVAVIRDFLRSYDAGRVELARVALVEGSRDRGFAELHWTARRSGTSQTLAHTVFIGFRYQGEAWTVDEVRVLR
jgi:hypothetical protein